MIYGVAVNDLRDHKTQIIEYSVDENGKKKRKVVWQCPFYARWFNMISRCYNPAELERHPTYEQKHVCEDWKFFSKFKAWMEQQEWEYKELDKDILFEGNLVYSPETCVFIPQDLNKFLLEKTKERDLPRGVSYHKKKKKYIASISCGENKKIKHIGTFDDPWSAHFAWAYEKLQLAKEIASRQTDKRIVEALINRYTDNFRKAESKLREFLSPS